MFLLRKRMRRKHSARDGMPSKRNGMQRQIRTLRSLPAGRLNQVLSNPYRKLYPPLAALLPESQPASEPMQRLKILLPIMAMYRHGVNICFGNGSSFSQRGPISDNCFSYYASPAPANYWSLPSKLFLDKYHLLARKAKF
jgi:hypothetical protein